MSNPIARELDDFWKESQSLWQQWQFEADIDVKMATNQQDYSNAYNINYRNQKMLQFNKILRILNMINGYQIDNRLATQVIPSDNEMDEGQTSDQMTKVIDWIMRQDSTYTKISDAFAGSNMCGLNLMRLWMDFRQDPENGEICSDRLPFSAFIMDPYWTKLDLSDCYRIWTRKYITARELESLIPGARKEMAYLGKGYVAKDGKFQFLPQNWYQYQQEVYAYDEYWVKDYREVRKILDKTTGELAEWKGTKDQFQLLLKYNPNVKLIKASVPTIKQYILVNNHIVHEEKSPFGLDVFPFVPFVCYHYTDVQNYAMRYQGIPRGIRDSQIELNRRRNRLLDILDAQVQSGLMVKEDALVNPEDAFFQGPGKVLYFKNSANLGTDVAPIPPPPVANGWMELIQTIEQEIMTIVGPEELFAQNLGAKEMTGILMKLKQGAGLVGLRNIFDRLNESQKHMGEIMLTMAMNNFSTGKIRHIIGEEPTPIIASMTDPENTLKDIVNPTLKYNIVINESELTDTQRQLQLMQALQFRQMDIPISNKYILEKSTLQGKKQIIEDIQAQEQMQQELQHMQAIQQMQSQETLNRSLEAKAQADFASAEERKSRAVSDIALAKERSSQAIQDRASAALDNAKALKELDHLDDDRLIKLANFIIQLEQHQKMAAGGEEGDSEEQASKVGSSVQASETESKQKQNQLSQALQQ